MVGFIDNTHNTLLELCVDYGAPLVEALPLGLGAAYYLGNRRARGMQRNVRYADMLLTELETMAKHLGLPDERLYLPITMCNLSCNVYDGLVSSTNLSYFDKLVQENLHSFYRIVKQYNLELESERVGHTHDSTSVSNEVSNENLVGVLRTVTDEIDRFSKQNKMHKWLRPAAKILRLYYEDK